MGIPEFERLQIEWLLGTKSIPIRQGLGLHLMSQTPASRDIFDAAVRPMMHGSGLDVWRVEIAFDSSSCVSDVASWIRRAEVITADVSDWNGDVAYVLGMCHALGRCPILIARRPVDLPFKLDEVRCIAFDADASGLHELRQELGRALRTYVNASRAAHTGYLGYDST